MKALRRALAFVLALVCSLTVLSAASFADGDSCWDGILDNDSPSSSDILAAENAERVSYPSGSNYLDYYQIRYVKANKGHSIHVFSSPSLDARHKYTVFHGQRVLRLAKKSNGFSFILFYYKDNVLRAGWVTSDNLVSRYPGRTAYIGGRSSGGYDGGDYAVSWSRGEFPGEGQRYAELDTPAFDCVGFTLDYMVTDRNGVGTGKVTGRRTVYIHDGSRWSQVGSFRYDELGPVHVEITLDAPTDVYAVGITADCLRPDKFDFRIAVLDVLRG